MRKNIVKSFAAFLLVLCMMLTNFGGWNLVLAENEEQVEQTEQANETKEEPQVNEEENKEETQVDEEEPKEDANEETGEEASEEDNNEDKDKTIEEDTDESENDGLEISDEEIPEAVGADVKAPTVDPLFYDATTISGKNLAKAKIDKKLVIATVHVSLKDSSGNEKANLSVTPKSGTTWKVKLSDGVKVAKGDTVTVYQQIGEDKSPEVTANAQPSKASTVTLTMPTGEIWVEQYVANILNADEKAEAIQMLKDANPTVADVIKSVEFNITGTTTKTASYIVTYTDDSISEEIEAPDLTVKKVTEYSRAPEIESITIVDNVIKGKLAGPGPFDGIKVQLVLDVKKEKAGDFCTDKGCKVDKESSNPIEVPVQNDGTFSYTLQAWDSLTLDQIVGVSVKEPHKFVSCSTTTVKPVIPEKTEVKDPRKLTAKDKEAIDAAIRKAYTVDGVSKLPNGTGDWGGVPAVIQFDDSGNVKIFSGNDVAGTWDPNNDYKFVPETNKDGSYKLNDGAQAKITIPAKDLVKNIKPDAPAVKLSDDKKNITITPNEKDTDANSISVSYTGKDGSTKTTTATKDENGTWSISEGEGSVDVNGVVSLLKNKVKGNTDVTAKVTDKGGVADDDTTPLTSDPGTLTVKETIADKVEALGGLDPVVMKKWVKDTIDWKDGVKVKDSVTEENKGKINELLKEAKTSFADTTRNTNSEGDFTGTIKVTFDDGSFIEVADQKLYVSNHVTSVERKDKVPTDALDVEFKLGEGTKVDNTGSGAIEGNKDNPTSYSNYKVKPGTNLKTYEIPTINSSVIDSINLTAQKGYTDPVWTSQNGTDFVASDNNKVFTATATKTYDITFDANTGTGTKDKVTLKKGDTYTLPPADTFTAPENMQFSGWQVGEDSQNLKNAGDQITITDNVTIKAIWKPIEVKVKFQTEAGASGTMEDKTVNKGSKYELPKPSFKPEEGKEFAGWKVPGEAKVKKAGDEIDISGDVTLTATWKDIEYKVTFNGNEGTGSMDTATVKKGEKYKLPDNSFGAPSDKQEFKAWEVDGKEVAPGTEITVDKDTEVKAIWKDIEYKVTFNGNTGTGSMDAATVKKGEKYKLPDNSFGAPSDKQEFKTWEVDGKEVAPGTEITIEKDTEVKAIWKDIEYKVTFNGNTGTGSMDAATVKKSEKYELPANGFTAPKNKEFDGWMVGTEKKAVGDKITINGDTEVKAIWKDIMIDITFDKGEGSGEMTKETVKKGSKYALPASKFTPPANQEFAGWKVGNESDVKAVGVEIDIDGEIKLTAVYKNKSVTPDKPDKPGTPDNPNRPYYPDYPSNPSKPSKPDTKPEPKPDTETPSQPGPGQEELPVTPKPDGTKEVKPDPEKTDKVDVTVTPEGGKPTNVEVEKDKDGNWISSNPDIAKVDPKTGKITIVKGAKDVRAIATLKLERGTHHKYLYGYPDGTVRPEGIITRAEAAALIARLANLDMSDASKPNFKDVPSRWYNSAINAVVKKNLMFANKDGKFRPNEAITRGEFARALFYIDKVNDAVAPFADVKGHEFEKAINQAYGNDRISGYPDGTFKPNAFIKRAEAAKILNHYANRGVDYDGSLGQRKYIAYFTDLYESYWGYYEIMEAANSHEYERPLNTRIETWTKIINK